MSRNTDEIPRVIKVRTWFGLDAVVEIPPTGLHRAGFGRFLFPHPPVANWLLRRGLSTPARLRLAAIHELGHLRALPLEFVYAVILFGIGISREHSSFIELLLLLLSCFAVWEIFAETAVMRHEGPGYRAMYSGVTVIPRVLFWLITVLLTIVGWLIALG